MQQCDSLQACPFFPCHASTLVGWPLFEAGTWCAKEIPNIWAAHGPGIFKSKASHSRQHMNHQTMEATWMAILSQSASASQKKSRQKRCLTATNRNTQQGQRPMASSIECVVTTTVCSWPLLCITWHDMKISCQNISWWILMLLAFQRCLFAPASTAAEGSSRNNKGERPINAIAKLSFPGASLKIQWKHRDSANQWNSTLNPGL